MDLSAEPKKTGIAVIEWHETCADLIDLRVGATDAEVVDAAKDVGVVGIDCPFGWPVSFRRFLRGDDRMPPEWPEVKNARPNSEMGEQDWRRWLAYRRTDYLIRERADIGIWPLSVASDKIALTAMRASVLLARLKSAGRRVALDGSGDVVEVYPAAALKRWRQSREGQGRQGLIHKGYKDSKGRSAREGLVQALFGADGLAHWLNDRDQDLVSKCNRTDDALDAVICALIAGVRASGKWHKPGRERAPGWAATDAELAATEGWIIAPEVELSELPREVWAAAHASPRVAPLAGSEYGQGELPISWSEYAWFPGNCRGSERETPPIEETQMDIKDLTALAAGDTSVITAPKGAKPTPAPKPEPLKTCTCGSLTVLVPADATVPARSRRWLAEADGERALRTGCTAPTKGAWAPGHDARAVGLLNSAVEMGTVVRGDGDDAEWDEPARWAEDNLSGLLSAKVARFADARARKVESAAAKAEAEKPATAVDQPVEGEPASKTKSTRTKAPAKV